MRPKSACAKKAPLGGLFFLLCLGGLFSCAALRPGGDSGQGVPVPEAPAWRPIEPGLWALEWNPPPGGVRRFAFKIDLGRENLRLYSWPAPEAVNQDGVFAAKSAREFAEETGAVLVINTTPFTAPGGLLSKKRGLSGAYRAGGKNFPGNPKYAALGFYADNRAFVLPSQTALPEDAVLAAGGFFSILKDGAVVPQKAARRDARTGAGVSADGKTLFLLIVRGRGGFLSRGMTYEECAHVLAALGAWNALQFDGGNSVSLVLKGKVLAGNPWTRPGGLLGFGGFSD